MTRMSAPALEMLSAVVGSVIPLLTIRRPSKYFMTGFITCTGTLWKSPRPKWCGSRGFLLSGCTHMLVVRKKILGGIVMFGSRWDPVCFWPWKMVLLSS